MLNRQTILSCVNYDKEQGKLTYVKNNKIVDNRNSQGYARVSIFGKRYLVHRVIWFIENGHIPSGMEIDHINQDKQDNRIINLRIVTSKQNKMNKALQKNNTSGTNGVYLNKDNFYEAHIKTSGKKIYLGSYETEKEAIAARHAANRVLNFSEIHGIKIGN